MDNEQFEWEIDDEWIIKDGKQKKYDGLFIMEIEKWMIDNTSWIIKK